MIYKLNKKLFHGNNELDTGLKNLKKAGFIVITALLLLIVTKQHVYGCAPNSNFNVDNATPVVGQTITFTDQSDDGGGSSINSWSWNFGSGANPGSATTKGPHNVWYSTTGNKTVSLTVSNNQGSDTNTKTNYITVSLPAPVAAFSANNLTPVTTDIVTFTDASTNSPTSWAWSFSPATVTYAGGTSATSQNPQVSFNNPGSYTVTLTATNSVGSDGETKTNYITVSSACPTITASVTGKTDVNCNAGADGTITVSASGGVAPYSYSVNNGTDWTASPANPYTFNNLVANEVYKIRVKDANGCESPVIP